MSVMPCSRRSAGLPAESSSGQKSLFGKPSTFLILLVLLGLSAPLIAADLPPELENLRSFYRNLERAHVKAWVEISIRAPLYEGHSAPVTGEGYIEHWENSAGFRTRTTLDPRLGLVDNFDIALNRGEYQLHNTGTDLLVIEDPRYSVDGLVMVPLATPNPLYLPALFMAPSDDECPGCQMNFEFLADSARWSSVFAGMETINERPSGSEASIGKNLVTKLISFGGSRQGEAYRYKIQVGGVEVSGDEAGLKRRESAVTRIERLRTDGKVVATYAFSEFEAVKGAGDNPFPTRILVAAHDPEEVPSRLTTAFTEYRLEILEVNQPLPEAAFSLAPGPRTNLWLHGELMTSIERQKVIEDRFSNSSD